jgi:uncharacterized protein with GYD domain
VSGIDMAGEYIGALAGTRLQPARLNGAPLRAYNRPRAAASAHRRGNMPKYLIEAAYTAEGLRGLQKDKASGRRQAVVKAVESLEGKVEAFYFAMGERDVVSIIDVPDAVSVAALSLAASASGLVRVKTTALLGAEEVDRALAKKLTYRGPGG